MKKFIKRFFDYFSALVMIILCMPILIVIALLIKIDSSGPIIFKQERIGKDGRPFFIYKFRTMNVTLSNEDILRSLSNADSKNFEWGKEITRVGNFLRAFALDELPQMINILKGEMSFIGPRPTLQYQYQQYDEFQKQRVSVLPGLSGWAQIKGRNEISWEERIKLDIWYIQNWSIWLDVIIILKTIKTLFARQGLYSNDHFIKK